MGVKGLGRKLAFDVHGSWIPAFTGMTEAYAEVFSQRVEC